jgi:hypothetical protein
MVGTMTGGYLAHNEGGFQVVRKSALRRVVDAKGDCLKQKGELLEEAEQGRGERD